MSLDRLYPFAGDHAVQNVVFALEWQGELSSTELTEIQTIAQGKLSAKLPQFQQQNMLRLNMDQLNAGMAGAAAQQDLGGFFLQKHGSFGQILRQLDVSRLHSAALVTDYSRWANVWRDVKEYFDAILPALLKVKPLTAIGLQYSDVFTWKADPSSLDIKQVFRKDTPYLAPNALAVSGQWHVHHGYFEDVDQPVQYRRLDNININVVDTDGTRAIQILTSHRAILHTPMWDTNRENDIENVVQQMHAANKAILCKLLSDEICAKINLV